MTTATQKVTIFNTAKGALEEVDKIVKSDEEWRQLLSPDEFRVARQKGTEPAFNNRYWDNKEKGLYQCVCCGTDLFSSETKYDSGTGWPSFWSPVSRENVHTAVDRALGMERTEVLCKRCDAHLGHLFDDGPAPTHQRYCMNSLSLRFVKG